MKTQLFNISMLLLLGTTFISCKNESNNEKTTIAKQTSTFVEGFSDGFLGKNNTYEQGYGLGDEAADFLLKNVDGSKVSLANYPEAKGFIVMFTCNTCPFVVASEDRIIALNEKYKPLGYPVIAINPNNPEVQPDDTFELMQAKAKEKGFTFPYLYGGFEGLYKTYGATKTPHIYLLQKQDGKNIVKYIGAIDDNVRNGAAVKQTFLANAIDELLAGKEVSVKETKAIGCSIKV